MPSNVAGDNPRPPSSKPSAPPPEQEHIPCPRCDSTNTKFCYYNNYNFSQPRHFCKSCRRYWTHGGTLRDIPVGGGSRKNAKRSRTAAPAAVTPITAVSSDVTLPTTPVFLPSAAACGGAGAGAGDGEMMKGSMGMCGSFTSLLSNSGPGGGPGFLGLGGFGLGLGHGFEEIGFGNGRGGWAFPGMVDGGGGVNGVGNTWQIDGGDGGFVGGAADCFSWPGLAISTPRNGLK